MRHLCAPRPVADEADRDTVGTWHRVLVDAVHGRLDRRWRKQHVRSQEVGELRREVARCVLTHRLEQEIDRFLVLCVLLVEEGLPVVHALACHLILTGDRTVVLRAVCVDVCGDAYCIEWQCDFFLRTYRSIQRLRIAVLAPPSLSLSHAHMHIFEPLQHFL